MNPIDQLFSRLRAARHKAFIPFLTAGDPDLEGTGVLLNEVVRRGVDLVEIGFPYSDPIADGAVIQASYTRALGKGLKIDAIFEFFESLNLSPNPLSEAERGEAAANPLSASESGQGERLTVPLAAMVSYSLVHRRGPAAFLDRAQKAGFSGAIVPDLPLDESQGLVDAARERDFKLIQLVTPTTPRERAIQIARQSTGFLYCVSVTGITGAREQLPPVLREQLAWLRTQTELPLCVGFGISRPEHVKMLKDAADGVIVGSAIVRRLEEVGKRPMTEVSRQIGELVQELRAALDS